MDDGRELARFAEDCGLSGPLRFAVDLEGGAARDPVESAGPFAVVGRDPLADLVLDHPAISRRHAYLQVISGRLHAIDLGSRTGSYWAAERRYSGWVAPGETLRLGPVGLGVSSDRLEAAGGAPPPTSRSFPAGGAPEVALDLPGPDGGRESWQASRVLVLIGRSTACRVQLAGAGVSPYHAALVRTGGGPWVVDIRGRRGLAVNGRQVRQARLRDGDEIGIGPHRIGVRLGLHAAVEPSTEVMIAPDPGRSIAATAREIDPALAVLLRQLGEVEGRRSDDSRQELVMMLRLFSGMHQDQMGLIRDELRLLREKLESGGPRQLEPGPAPVAGPPAPRPDRVVKTQASPPAPPEASPPVDLHFRLMQKLSAIGDERRSPWRRFLASIRGGRSGGGVLGPLKASRAPKAPGGPPLRPARPPSG